MRDRNILIVTVDGLRAGALGAYGNTTFGTPALDRFAADSFLLDACFSPAADLATVYRALWRSQHPLRPATGGQTVALPKILAENGYKTTFVADERSIAEVAGTTHFERYLEINSEGDGSSNQARPGDASQTAMAKLFAASCDVIHTSGDASALQQKSLESAGPRFVWIHSRGMYGPWDAPIELQQELLDEGDPSPVEDITPPDFWLSETHDPDAIFRYSCAYAAQIIMLDSCWSALMEAVDIDKNEWLVALLGLQGFPLGEHRRIGGVDYRMYGEQLHVPWLIRFSSGAGRLARSSALASHVDLLPTVLDWLEIKMPQESTAFDGSSVLPLAANARASWRDVAMSTSPTSRAIRTSEWCLRQDIGQVPDSSEPIACELYVRPDDRWEANDVAKLCPDEVEILTSRADELALELGESSKTA